jgi:glycosyltransferase involved in cell wall biosynthesis
LQWFSGSDICVVDDGSEGAQKIDQRKLPQGVCLIRHEHRLGKGAAIKSGIAHFAGADYTHVLCMDGDCQHRPEDIPAFLHCDPGADLVIGNRMNNLSAMPMARRLSNILTSMIIRWRSGLNVRDSQNGYRRLRLDLYHSIEVQSTGFQFESELLLRLRHKNVRVLNVDIPTIYNNAGSSIRHFGDTFRFIALIGQSFWWQTNE